MDKEQTKAKIVKKTSKIQNNIIFLFIGLIILIALIMARYAWIQIFRGDEMLSKLEAQVQDSAVLHVPRGTIYDADMKELAISTIVDS